MKATTPWLIALAFLLAGIGSALAQGTNTRISGLIRDHETNEALIGAYVQATNTGTGFTTGAVTDADGRFLLKELPIGGPYELEISYVGYSAIRQTGYQLSQGDFIDLGTVAMKAGDEMLDVVTVTYNAFKSDKSRLGTAKKIDSQTMARIPTTTRNYNELASLSPLSRGTTAAGSKGGQAGYVLDGVSNRRNVFGDLTGGAFPVSMEAVREFEVVSNAYDVTNGRGGGSIVKAITKSGTNDFHGSVFGFYSGQALTGDVFLRDSKGESKTVQADFTTSQYGFSIGGPIIKDKLHFFVTADRYTNESPWSVLDFETAGSTLEEGEKNLNITKANMDEIVSILEGDQFQVPIPESGKQYGTIQTKTKTSNILARLDYRINKNNLLTFRYNYHDFYNPRKNNGLLSTQYEENSYDNSFLLSLRTQINDKTTNDLRVSFTDLHRLNELIFNRAPVGRVQVTSKWDDGTSRTRWIFWGNQYWIPEIIAERDYQIVDNFNFQAGKNRFTVGFDLLINQIRDHLTHYQQGEFFYASIEDLRNNKPYRYERKTPIGDAGGFVYPRVLEGGLYGQMETNLTRDLNLVAGLRWDATYIPKKPKFNELLYQELGVRNDVAPFDWTGIQPRINLTWDINSEGKDLVKLGLGSFVSQFTTQVLTASNIDNGVDFKYVVADATLPGFSYEDLPKADWPNFFQDFDKYIPGEEYLNELVEKGLYTVPPATVVLLDENLKTPKTWKFNLNYFHYFNDWVNVGIGGYYNQTSNNYMYRNLNLRDEPYFTLDSEGGRNIYVPLETLTGASQAKYDFAKKSDKFTQVLQFTNADWNARFMALVLEANFKLKDGSLNISYTRGMSKGATIYNSGDYSEAHLVGDSYQNWGNNMKDYYDGNDLKHKILIAGVSPSFYGFTVSTTVIAQQADRYTAGIGGTKDLMGVNVNAPGNNIILPYVFDPNDPATPQYLRDGINTVLENADPSYADYIRDNIGGYAAGFGGLQPWKLNWNLSLAKQFKIAGSNRIEIRADIFNVLNLLNSKWGGFYEIFDTNLYDNVEKFDAETKSYVYKVNLDAGQKRYRVTTPYQVQFGIKYLF